MKYDLQTLLHDALINNTYDYEDMHRTLDSTLESSFSYLYFLQKARVEYEELFRYSGEEYTRDFEKIGHLYLDELNFANFDIDYEMINTTSRERFRQSKYYFRFNHFVDLVDNPDIFNKIPIVIIDDKVIWDYEIKITKDGATFKLPYRWDFVYERLRNPINKNDYVYIYHKIQVIIVDNCYYKRIGDDSSTHINKNSIQNYLTNTLTIPKSWLTKVKYYEVYNMNGTKTNERIPEVEFIHNYKSIAESASLEIKVGLGKTKTVSGYTVNRKGVTIFLYAVNHDIPEKSHGTMMMTIHYPNINTFEYKVPKQTVLDKVIDTEDHPLFDVITPDEVKDDIHQIEYETKTKTMAKSFEMGTILIPLTDNGDNYTAVVTDDINNTLRNSTGDIYLSFVFMEGLIEHTFYTNDVITTARVRNSILGTEFAVLEKDKNTPYNMPIPVEDFMVFKKTADGGFYLEKNTDMLELHYPNIYKIKDENMKTGDQYKLYYFYYPLNDVIYTPVDAFYFKFMQDHFVDYGTERIINEVYYGTIDYGDWTEEQKTEFEDVFRGMYEYTYNIYKYGDSDFLERYIKENPEGTPIQYKDETLKQWMRWTPEVLHKYVLHQNKLGSSYHLFTKTINLDERVRKNADFECGYRKRKEVIYQNIPSGEMVTRLSFVAWKEIKSGVELFYDEDGVVYQYNSTTKHYEKTGDIGPIKLKDKIDKGIGITKVVLAYGSGDETVIPNPNISYMMDNPIHDVYRWDGDEFVKFVETHEFDKERYVFAFNNETKEYPDLLDLRVFVDGIMVIDIYHERHLYMDYIYIPCDMVTTDSYIEIEVFPRYSFKSPMKFSSLDDYHIITLVEPEEVIFPTLADIYVENREGELPARISPSYFDVTVITDAKDTAYYETVSTAEGDRIEESRLKEMVVTGDVVRMTLQDGTFVYRGAGNLIYKYDMTLNGTVYYQGFRDTVYYYVIKNHKWTKYLLDDGRIIEDNIPEESVDYKSMKKGKAKLYLEAKDIHATEDEDPYPVKFARLSIIKIKPKDEYVLNKKLMFQISKNPQGIPLVVDRDGYPYLEITGKNFNFNKEYIRVFVNGRLMPRCKYDFYTTFYCPRLVIYEWVNKGDYIYLDVTPYRYKEIYYSETLEPNQTLIDLRKYINKPFDIRYYDVYMNGRKLSLNNVFSISPWEMTLVNLKSQYHLTIYERDRDWEWYGLDYNENIYVFTLDDLFSKSFVTQEDKNRIIKEIIDKQKDSRLTINPNEFVEEKLNYNDDFSDATDFFIFYYYELIPKGFMNPDVKQISTEVMIENFPDVYSVHKTTSYEQDYQDEEQKERRKDYIDVLYLNPDVITEGREVYFDSTMGYYKFSEDRNIYVYFTKDGEYIYDRTMTPDLLIKNVNYGVLRPGRIIMNYMIGHPDDNIPQELLDDSSSIVIPEEENITKKGE